MSTTVAGRHIGADTTGQPAALVVDRHRLFADVMTPSLEELAFQVSIATGTDSAREFITTHRPTLTLVDLSLPADGGFELGQHALATHPEAIVIGTTPRADPARVRESRAVGFSGCLSKDIPLSRFTSQIRAAIGGEPVEQPRGNVDLVRGSHYAPPRDLLAAQLTARELEVLALLVEGAGSGQIARTLDISWNTVRTHAQSILTKLQVHSRLEAAAVAVRQGLVPDPAVSAVGAS